MQETYTIFGKTIEKNKLIILIVAGVVCLGVLGAAVYFGFFYEPTKDTDVGKLSLDTSKKAERTISPTKNDIETKTVGGADDSESGGEGTPTNITCSDTDKGGEENLLVKGDCIDNTGTIPDKCFNDLFLGEGKCDIAKNSCTFKLEDCSFDLKACVDGTCSAAKCSGYDLSTKIGEYIYRYQNKKDIATLNAWETQQSKTIIENLCISKGGNLKDLSCTGANGIGCKGDYELFVRICGALGATPKCAATGFSCVCNEGFAAADGAALGSPFACVFDWPQAIKNKQSGAILYDCGNAADAEMDRDYCNTNAASAGTPECCNKCTTTNNVYSCTDCKKISIPCVDSDGGKNYFTAGYCIDSLGGSNRDRCINGQTTEWYCGADNTCKSETAKCNGACQSGVCSGVTCIDSDNGDNSKISGSCQDVRDPTKVFSDKCAADKSTEYICKNTDGVDICALVTTNCVCSADGISCSGCTDPDFDPVNNGVFVASTCQGKNNALKDFCNGNTYIYDRDVSVGHPAFPVSEISEASCTNAGDCAYDARDCNTAKCEKGKCVDCYDSDEGDKPTVSGICVDYTGNFEDEKYVDSCDTNSHTITEYVCKDSDGDGLAREKCVSINHNDGICKDKTSFIDCIDSDKGLISEIAGTCTGVNGPKSDVCENDAWLSEAHCTKNGCEVITNFEECAAGCSNAKCNICFDSDGGDAPAVDGTCTQQLPDTEPQQFSDSCIPSINQVIPNLDQGAFGATQTGFNQAVPVGNQQEAATQTEYICKPISEEAQKDYPVIIETCQPVIHNEFTKCTDSGKSAIINYSHYATAVSCESTTYPQCGGKCPQQGLKCIASQDSEGKDACICVSAVQGEAKAPSFFQRMINNIKNFFTNLFGPSKATVEKTTTSYDEDGHLSETAYTLATCHDGTTGISYTDKCSSSNDLLEYDIENNKCIEILTHCPDGCTNGVCKFITARKITIIHKQALKTKPKTTAPTTPTETPTTPEAPEEEAPVTPTCGGAFSSVTRCLSLPCSSAICAPNANTNNCECNADVANICKNVCKLSGYTDSHGVNLAMCGTGISGTKVAYGSDITCCCYN